MRRFEALLLGGMESIRRQIEHQVATVRRQEPTRVRPMALRRRSRRLQGHVSSEVRASVDACERPHPSFYAGAAIAAPRCSTVSADSAAPPDPPASQEEMAPAANISPDRRTDGGGPEQAPPDRPTRRAGAEESQLDRISTPAGTEHGPMGRLAVGSRHIEPARLACLRSLLDVGHTYPGRERMQTTPEPAPHRTPSPTREARSRSASPSTCCTMRPWESNSRCRANSPLGRER